MQENFKYYINLSIALIIAIGIAINGFFIANAFIKVKAQDRSVVVKGFAEQQVQADQGELILTFKNIGNHLSELQHKNELDHKIIVEFLKKQGFTEQEINFDYIELLDRQTLDYLDHTKIDNRYIIINRLKVNTNKVDLIKKVTNQLNELIKQEININAQDKYYFTQFTSIRNEMLAAATKSARSAASEFAKDANAKVGTIKHAVQGAFTITSLNKDYDDGDSLYKKIRVVTTITFNLLD